MMVKRWQLNDYLTKVGKIADFGLKHGNDSSEITLNPFISNRQILVVVTI